MQIYFPSGWGDSDGCNGARVDDAGALYVYDDDDDSETCDQILYKTSITEVVNDLIDMHRAGGDGLIISQDGIMAVRRIQGVFLAEIERLENSIRIQRESDNEQS